MIPKTLDHPRRYALTNELHARPFVAVQAPGRILSLAFKQQVGAAERDPEADREHLIAFIDRHGGPHPAPSANHHTHDFGRFRMKWERHTEFVTYMLYRDGEAEGLFEADLAEMLPPDWLETAPGKIISAIQLEVIRVADMEAAQAVLAGPIARAFDPESLAVAQTLDATALAVGDFRIHEGGLTRFALIVHDEAGPRRIGRACQRLIEIETYRTLAMLALPIARQTARRLNEIERELTQLIQQVADEKAVAPEAEILAQLTALSAEIEALSAATAFRFGAGRAYEAIVTQRIESLREERLRGRQLFSEFMVRRFDPAMRTCHATERRLTDLADRASRIAELIRTRVDVAVEAQNMRLLKSMDERAALQLRLQETVEGLSVVAISYYAVSLAAYVLAPLTGVLPIGKTELTAIVAVPVILIVWGGVRRMRRRLEARAQDDDRGH